MTNISLKTDENDFQHGIYVFVQEENKVFEV